MTFGCTGGSTQCVGGLSLARHLSKIIQWLRFPESRGQEKKLKLINTPA